MKFVKYFTLSVFLFIASHDLSFAGIHYIEFGGNHGLSYVPQTIADAMVGDTIVWKGDFSSHPLQSVSVPAGADSFGPIFSGIIDSFIYVIKIPGTYAYKCNIHFGQGMVGGFSAVGSGVKESNSTFSSVRNFPNPFNQSTNITFSLLKPSMVNIQVLDIKGNNVYHLTLENQECGTHQIAFDGSALSSGIYVLKIQSGEAILTKQMVIAR